MGRIDVEVVVDGEVDVEVVVDVSAGIFGVKPAVVNGLLIFNSKCNLL